MNLSTSSSSPKLSSQRKCWYRLSLDIVGAIAAIGLLELGLHVGIDKLSLKTVEPFKIEEGLSLRAATIDTAIEKAENVDTLDVSLIGSSLLNDIDTEVLSEQLNDSPVEKFTLVGANSRGSSLMLENVVLPNVESDWVVYMVSPHDVNARSPVEERNISIPGIDAYAENQFIYKFSRGLETNLYLFRYRRAIVQFLPSIDSIRQIVERHISPPEEVPAPTATYEFATYTEFETATRFLGDLEHIYQLSTANNSRLAILAVPTNPDADVTYEQFQQGADDWLKTVQDFAEERDIVVVNGFDLLDEPAQYRDTHHLNEAGAQIVIQALAGALQADDFEGKNSPDR